MYTFDLGMKARMVVLRRLLYLRCVGGEFPLGRGEVAWLVAVEGPPESAAVAARIDQAMRAGRGRRLTLRRGEEEVLLGMLDRGEQRGALTARLHALQLGLRQASGAQGDERSLGGR